MTGRATRIAWPCVLFALLLGLQTVGLGQAKEDYMRVLDSIFKNWNNRNLRLPPKREFERQFSERLRQRTVARPFGYEDKKWASQLGRNWDKLPEEATPKLPLSDAAQSTLRAEFLENIDHLKDREVRPEREEVLREAGLSLFIVFGRSQQLAMDKGETEISRSDVKDALFEFFTGVYPFCRPDAKHPWMPSQ